MFMSLQKAGLLNHKTKQWERETYPRQQDGGGHETRTRPREFGSHRLLDVFMKKRNPGKRGHNTETWDDYPFVVYVTAFFQMFSLTSNAPQQSWIDPVGTRRLPAQPGGGADDGSLTSTQE